jgi:hypothetical protein
MSSVTQKGKPSDHAPISTANANNSQASTTSTATPGIGNLIVTQLLSSLTISTVLTSIKG